MRKQRKLADMLINDDPLTRLAGDIANAKT
jgi:hypothetical protein